MCCQSASDFPNNCLIGACGCSPDNSHSVKVCDCGEGTPECEECAGNAATATQAFLGRLPEVRRLLSSDVEAAYEGDPAAKSFNEVILSYPGLEAIAITDHLNAPEFLPQHDQAKLNLFTN